VSESQETIERECLQSLNRSRKRRQEVSHRRTFWTFFWAVIVVGAWIAVGLWAVGIVKI